ncbi:RHS domain-containing protein [Vibrio mediterranei]|nr:RHS domain-containing protein [Vibrio mediterranei]
MLVAYLFDGTIYHVHNDHLGTPQALTDESGATVWKASYSPFGKATVTTEQIKFNLRFPGQYYDAETGLHYNWHRYYDPSLGRYLQSDPLGLHAGVDTYGYVNGNPLSLSDPTGLCPWCLGGAAIAAAIDVFVQYNENGGFNNFNYLSLVTSAGTGFMGGGLGTVTTSISTRLGWLAVSNMAGNAAIGAGAAYIRNEIGGECNRLDIAALNGGVAGLAGVASAKGVSDVLRGIGKKRYDALPLEIKTFFDSNAFHGIPRPEIMRGTTSAVDAIGNTVSNMPYIDASRQCGCQ